MEAVLGQSGLNHHALAAEIRRRFGGRDVAAGALLQEPVVEAAFPFLEADMIMDSLSGSLLEPSVVDALDLPGDPRIGRDWHPYQHQLEAWRLLTDQTPQSILVTSGTGSGKTECFMVPLLDDLAREAPTAGTLSGVRAIALYPLNALIASQQERLRKWTAPFRGKLRFALYNGEMPEDDKEGRERSVPEQILCRRTLRADPPPILVTNVTMLEYLTVRRKDRRILDASQGKLRWIILDEAHSYTGSRAAEIALLLRRVLLGFGVTPGQVRFVATSATIGEGADVTEELRRFLRDVSGAPEERIHVVVGHRRRPQLPPAGAGGSLLGVDVAVLDPAAAFDLLAPNPIAQEQIAELAEKPRAWRSLAAELARTGADPQDVALALARAEKGGERLLPLRVHAFHRAVPGLWSCIDPLCTARPDGWPFGGILSEAVDQCPNCGGIVLPVVSCRGCGEPYLDAVEKSRILHGPDRDLAEDEFAMDSDEEAAASPDGENEPSGSAPEIARLLASRPLPHARPLHVDPQGGHVADGPGEGVVALSSHDRYQPECCPACEMAATTKQPRVLWPFRFGAPAILSNASPILLEGMERPAPDPQAEYRPPAEGRQLLSFTDSRQGTARFAAKLQNAAERNHIRALVYFAVQDAGKADPTKADQIQILENALGTLRLAGADPASIALVEKKRDELSGGSHGLPWETVRQRLIERDEVSHWMRKVWSKRDAERFGDPVKGPERFAELMLLRELARRTKRANSLETMGLAKLRFPQVESLKEAHLPDGLRARGKSIQDWRDFLYLGLTVAVRDYFAIRIDRRDAHWLQPGVPTKRLIGPQDGVTARNEVRWPQVRPDYLGNRGTLPRLLEAALGLDAEDRGDRETINELLEKAWFDLRPLFVTSGGGGDLRLDLAQAIVQPIVGAWRCPVTRRVLDTVFCGFSPYGLRTGATRGRGAVAEPIAMSRHPAPFLTEAGDEDRVRSWLEADDDVSRLRALGLWTDLHDRIALGSPYARSAEHSAQQPSRRLRNYETEFRRGEINILNCSTTMEMGVDIGSVSTVMMTNVPPSIANYRQRVGRAGRRRQATALAFTYCKDSPIEREAFRDPGRFLARSVAAPRVSLDARPLVQRHVNALLLAAFVRQQRGDATTAKAGAFYGYPADLRTERLPDPPSVAFRSWLAKPTTEASMSESIAELVRGSALEGDSGLSQAASEAVEKAETEFRAEWDGLQSQSLGLDRESARKAIGFQLTRLCGEFLLSDLSNRGFLPGHGFPTAVVQFVHKDEPDSDEADNEEGNPLRRRHFASRNLDQAMRDYAPGADVVIDGLVYRSGGVTLNWKRPAGDKDARGIQSLGYIWHCPSCAAAGTSHSPLDECSECGAAGDSLRWREFLRPAGFAAERQPAHAEADIVSYVPPLPPIVAARGAAWYPLRIPDLGRMRGAHDGLVFYSSAGGEAGLGYTLCLHCGRAQPGGVPGLAPFSQHEPLRYTKADIDGKCPGASSPFAVKERLLLGHDVRTDVFELQLHGLDAPGAAWALGSATRMALTRELGVEIGEIGLAVEPRATAVAGRVFSILLFDHAAGGAGFSIRATDLFPKLLKPIRYLLDCSVDGCVKGCSSCVLTSDLRDQQEIIDRVAALEFLNDRLGQMAEPEPADRFAPEASFSDRLVNEIVTGTGRVVVWSDLPDVRDLREGDFVRLAASLQRAGRPLALVLPNDDWSAIDDATRLGLRDFATRYDIELRRGNAPRYPNGAKSLAALIGPDDMESWVSRGLTASKLGPGWAMPEEFPILRSNVPIAEIGAPVAANELELRPDAAYLSFTAEADGPLLGFGDRLLGQVQPLLERIGGWRPGRLAEVSYYDRYLKSPLSVRLALEFLASLARPGRNGDRIPVKLVSEPYRSDPRFADKGPWQVHHDWRSDDHRAGVTEEIAARLGLDATVELKRDRHARQLNLVFDDGSISTLLLDQGFGSWSAPAGIAVRFDFSASREEQATKLQKLNLILEGPRDPSYIVAHCSTPKRN